MTRARGVSEIQLGLYLAGFALICAAVFGVHRWWEEHNDSLLEQGRSEERLKWQEQARNDQAKYDAAIAALRAEKDAALGELQGKLAKAEGDFLAKKKEHDDEALKNAAFERGLHDGSIVFVDPGVRAGNPSGGSPGPAGPGTLAARDAPPSCGGGRISASLAEYLDAEAARADALVADLVEQLNLAQDTVQAYYLIAKDQCRAPSRR